MITNRSMIGDFYRGKTVLITGDTGFKGSWAVLCMLHLGAKVIGYALPPEEPRWNFSLCGLDETITHYDGDVRDSRSLGDVFHRHEPEIAFHFAAQPLVITSYEDPHGTFETNVMGTIAFLDAVRRTPSVRAAIIVTSDKCYENREWLYGYRETDRLGGNDPYSASKACAEIVTQSYTRSFFRTDDTANVASVRAGNVIGGGDWARHRIVPDCIRALLANETIVLRNPGAVRPWQHVLEPLYGYFLLGARLADDAELAGAWNFGPPPTSQRTVVELVDQLIESWGGGDHRVEAPKEARHEAGLLALDSSKAMHRLPWNPVMDFRGTIEATISGYRLPETTAAIVEHRLAQVESYWARQNETRG
ncbi:MAG: CDP-glucose 4,6-dehydratase [Myxococcales bacterium]|nr:CDP-glucose 4,6-dehydratase [Myxococcales bacterium]